jgi:transglutaminase-like putative cysteine protease
MKLQVSHQLHYIYTQAVLLEPHTLYLHPKVYPHQRVLSYALEIVPTPSMLVRNVDVEGNVQQLAYFSSATEQLQVSAQMVVESEPFNVFDFVLYPFECKQLPFQYPERTLKYLTPYLVQRDGSPYVEQFARQIASRAKWETVPFLTELSSHIHREFVYQVREEGMAFGAEQTLLGRSGSCRDFALLFMAACRAVGIASRFVSGYLFGNPLQAHELHAWVEVYLPGAGWRGFDPTEGQAMNNNHIAMGASADYHQLAPVMGTFRGQALSSLHTEVSIEEAGS